MAGPRWCAMAEAWRGGTMAWLSRLSWLIVTLSSWCHASWCEASSKLTTALDSLGFIPVGLERLYSGMNILDIGQR